MGLDALHAARFGRKQVDAGHVASKFNIRGPPNTWLYGYTYKEKYNIELEDEINNRLNPYPATCC